MDCGVILAIFFGSVADQEKRKKDLLYFEIIEGEHWLFFFNNIQSDLSNNKWFGWE